MLACVQYGRAKVTHIPEATWFFFIFKGLQKSVVKFSGILLGVHNTSDSGHELNGLNGIIVSTAGILKVKNNLGGRVS